jgi:hypothetical protein
MKLVDNMQSKAIFPMAITYEFDVAPHLRRGLRYRRMREERLYELHKHDGRAAFWQITLAGLFLFWGAVAYGIYCVWAR